MSFICHMNYLWPFVNSNSPTMILSCGIYTIPSYQLMTHSVLMMKFLLMICSFGSMLLISIDIPDQYFDS